MKQRDFKRGGYSLKVYSVIVSGLLIVVTILFCFITHRAGYDRKLFEKLGILEETYATNWTANGWERSLQKMHYDSDVVFLGDSITAGSDFQSEFPTLKIVELGVPGDTILGMEARIGMVKCLSPEKVFLQGGINSLKDYNSEKILNQYKNLIVSLKEALPDSEIFVQSILPISNEKEKTVCRNRTISSFNVELEALCRDLQVTYIDLFSAYEKNGSMNPNLTKDGIHLKQEAYSIWVDIIKDCIE